MGNAVASTWYERHETCPDCGGKLERLRVAAPPTIYDVAERCAHCGWRTDFVPEGDEVQLYRSEGVPS